MPRTNATGGGGSGGGSGTVTSVSSPNTSIVVTNPTTTPALAVGTLDELATNGAPAADWSNNSHKITNLANGSSAQDAAAFGQIVSPRDQLRITGQGILSEPFNALQISQSLTLPTQNLVASSLGLRKGDVVTGIVTRVSVAAAGTLPTTVRFALLDATGKVLVLTGNQNALASWAIGPNKQPFTAPYTVLADGLFYAGCCINGTWGSAQPTFGLSGSPDEGVIKTIATFAPPNFSTSGVTDFPAVGSSVAITTQNTRTYYLACY